MPVGLRHWIRTPEGPGLGVACESQAEASGWPEAEDGAACGAGSGREGGRTPGPVPHPGPLGLAHLAGSAGHADFGNRPVAPDRPAAAASVGVWNSDAVVDGCRLKRPRTLQDFLSRFFYDR